MGKASRRWRGPGLMRIPTLVQFRVIRTPFFSVFFHRFTAQEGHEWPHEHPWPFWSFMLRGWYVEDIYDRPGHLHGSKIRRALSVHKMRYGQAHTLTHTHLGTITMVVTGRQRQGSFVFWVGEEKVPSREYFRSLGMLRSQREVEEGDQA